MNAKVREQVRESRKAQGLNPTVESERFLELLAREVTVPTTTLA